MSSVRRLDDAPWLKSGPAARVLTLLNGDGEEARVVGGAVRNALLDLPIGDVDIATTALPEEVNRRAKAAGTNGDLSYALRRFDNEAHRIFGVLNLGLFNKQYVAAGQYTIADMICYPWASGWETRDIKIDEFPNVKRWLEEIGARPAVKKAMALGPEFREDPASISPEEQARRKGLVADQRAQPIPAEWLHAAEG